MMSNKLPTLIFSETHIDPIQYKILAKLTPILKTLGYEVFIDEKDPTMTLSDVIQDTKTDLEAYNMLNTRWASIGLDIRKFDDFIKGLEVLYKDALTNKSLLESFCYTCTLLISRHETTEQTLSFLLALKENNFNYVGGDIKNDKEIKTSEDLMNSMSRLSNMREHRDKVLALSYLQTAKQSFGRIGNFHVKGIQEEILKKFSHEEASANFCFFHLNSFDKSQNLSPNLIRDILIEKAAPNQIRPANDLPLGLIDIDARNKTDDEIVELVLKHIIEKKDKLKEPMTIKNQLIVSNHSIFPKLLLSQEGTIDAPVRVHSPEFN